MAGHVAIKTDDAGNIKPTKEKSSEKIDIVIAGIMGVGVAIAQEPETDMSEFLASPVYA
jgi:phage terminase large subunit-like protein